MTTLFIGSSSAAKSQARAIALHFTSGTLKFLPWWEAFTPGRTLIEDLDEVRGKVDGAILVFSPESSSTIRGNVVSIPNINVLFEFGYFYGCFGKQKTAIIKYGDYYLPTDLGGYVHIVGGKYFKRGAVTQVGKRTENDFNRWVQKL